MDAQQLPAGDASTDPMPTVLVPGPHQTGDGTVAEVGTNNFAEAVLRAMTRARLYRRAELLGIISGLVGAKEFRKLTPTQLRLLIDSHVRLEAWGTGGEPGAFGAATSYVACSHDNANLVLAAAASSDLPVVERIIHHPVLGRNLRLASPGLDRSTSTFYDPPPELMQLEPLRVGAMEVIRDLLYDFPFAGDGSFENAVGLALTLIVRQAIEGHVPIHLALAPQPRLGKTTLIEVIFLAVMGVPLRWLQLGRTEEERQKQITAGVDGDYPALGFDNLEEGSVIDSPALASFVTSLEWLGRLLGQSTLRARRNQHVVVATGNNLEATEELAKRIVPINLLPVSEPRPPFRHRSILAKALEVRPAFLSALLGLIENWKDAGCPPAPRRVPGFEGWCDVVGGVLANAGATRWLENHAAWLESATPSNSDAMEFVRAWHDTFGDARVSATQLLPVVRRAGVYPDVLDHREVPGQVRSLGRTVLRILTNRVIEGMRVVRTTSGSTAKYRLERLQPAEPTQEPPVPGFPG